MINEDLTVLWSQSSLDVIRYCYLQLVIMDQYADWERRNAAQKVRTFARGYAGTWESGTPHISLNYNQCQSVSHC
jgi:hypothetical protein